MCVSKEALVITFCNGIPKSCTSRRERTLIQLETVSIAEPLQNRQQEQTPYVDQIWHETVGQWFMLIGLISLE